MLRSTRLSFSSAFKMLVTVGADISIMLYTGAGKAYGVATISRLLKMIGLFCKRGL